MKRVKCHVARVFTNRARHGNLLGVVTETPSLSAADMQRVAARLGYSETSFVFPPAGNGEDYRVRFFTPKRELPFAGHPALGTLFVLRARGLVAKKSHYIQAIGRRRVALTVRPGGLIVMEQGCPAFLKTLPRSLAAGLLKVEAGAIAATPRTVSTGLPMLLIPLAAEKDLENCRIDGAAYRAARKRTGADCVMPFAVTPKGVRCRMFAPSLGVAEDPATGSGCGPLAVYLVREKFVPRARGPLRIFQGKKGSQSLLLAWVRRAGGRVTGVEVGGSCVMQKPRMVLVK